MVQGLGIQGLEGERFFLAKINKSIINNSYMI